MMHALIVSNVLMCALGFAAIYTSTSLFNKSVAANVQLRNARVESQLVQQSIVVLESKEYLDLIANLDSSINELKIRLAELISNSDVQVDISDVSYQWNTREAGVLSDNQFPIHLHRLNIKFNASHTIALAEFMEGVKSAMTPWPSEVRACEVHRLQHRKLLANCVLDVYFWGSYD